MEQENRRRSVSVQQLKTCARTHPLSRMLREKQVKLVIPEDRGEIRTRSHAFTFKHCAQPHLVISMFTRRSRTITAVQHPKHTLITSDPASPSARFRSHFGACCFHSPAASGETEAVVAAAAKIPSSLQPTLPLMPVLYSLSLSLSLSSLPLLSLLHSLFNAPQQTVQHGDMQLLNKNV